MLGKWLIGYVWPYNALFMAVTALYWYVVLPDWATMKTMSWGWSLRLYAVNAAGVFLFFGAVELF